MVAKYLTKESRQHSKLVNKNENISIFVKFATSNPNYNDIVPVLHTTD